MIGIRYHWINRDLRSMYIQEYALISICRIRYRRFRHTHISTEDWKENGHDKTHDVTEFHTSPGSSNCLN